MDLAAPWINGPKAQQQASPGQSEERTSPWVDVSPWVRPERAGQGNTLVLPLQGDLAFLLFPGRCFLALPPASLVPSASSLG